MDVEPHSRRAWIWAGACSIASGLVTLQANGGPVRLWIGAGLMAVALLLVAFGGGRRSNIVRGDLLGTVALALWAVWVLVRAAAEALPALATVAPGPAFDLVWLALVLVAAVMIARAGGFRSPWRWAPLVMLGAVAVTWALAQVILIGASMTADQETLTAVSSFASLILAAWPVALGVLAILAGTGLGRGARSVEVVESPGAAPVHDQHP
ncbi:hypothetical protein LK09_19215 [Microbacterium mangrovi]|uniref:Uncharacterized protein n=1 Tax=Microbacterium mangrovi TaxID=1348253 RepID=A0A0B1ZWB9_9MICO|nr:hypothetical protein [Microbacterium mangrovi]KHK95503.1 hypothetical protein LK09_19215 [Microbacterium mangrovi]